MSHDAALSDRARVLALIERHGWNATAFQTLESGYDYFFPNDGACVAYVDTRGAWVAAGAPIAAEAEIASSVAAFVQAAQAAGRRCCFFGVEGRLLRCAGGSLRALGIGEQPVFDPADWPKTLAEHRSLREQLRRARAKGVSVRELAASELAHGRLRAELERVIERWLATRGMAPMSFLVQIEPFEFLSYRRWFVAERGGRALAFGGVVPVPLRDGWFLEDLLRDPKAPNGTNELVIDAVMRWAASAGSRWLTLGLSPLSGNVSRPLAWIRRGAHPLYDFGGLRQYKAKFRPTSWCPIYLAYPQTQGALRSLLDALAAFARGGLVSFGLRSLGRGPLSAVRIMAILLVPWTALLAAAPAERWFTHPPTRWAWVLFDLAVLFGLWRLLRRPRARLARGLAIAISADSALTALEIGAWLTQRKPTWSAAVVFGLAWLAPTFAAFVLWGASRRLRTLAAEAP